MHWTPAEFFVEAGDRIRCTLCPHECELADEAIGACHVRRRMGHRLETATFATTVRHLDAVERKPLYHYKPGTRALTLAAPGCSFTCLYCQNYRLSQYGRSDAAPWDGEPADVESIVTEAADAGAAIALSYSEPSLAAELTLALSQAARPRGIDLLWKTNGFLTPAALERLAPCLTAVNVDVKAADDERHRALTGAALAPVLAAIAAFVQAGVWVEVSTPLIPRFNADADSVRRMAESLCRISRDIPWHLLRFSPEYKMSELPPTPPAALEDAARIGREVGLRYIYVERALGEQGRNTSCPNCSQTVVTRDIWMTKTVALANGQCTSCGHAIAGRWKGAHA